MASRAGSLLRLIPKAPTVSPLRSALPLRGGGGHGHGPDPNAVSKFFQFALLIQSSMYQCPSTFN